jgi:thiol-disulfide isomerase/thioredoxin
VVAGDHPVAAQDLLGLLVGLPVQDRDWVVVGATPEQMDVELDHRFSDTVQPFLNSYCIRCHSGATPKAQLDLKPHLESVKAKFEAVGFDVVANNGEQFAQFLADEIARWKTVIETGKITAE